MKAYFISLGCPKNLTDTEVLMGKLASLGHTMVAKPSQADMIIINTCAFIKAARKEAVQTIKKMKKYRKKIYLAGCLPKTQDLQLVAQDIDGIINSMCLPKCCTPRIRATPPWYAYVKIAEGCNNRCSYCLIPKIRGKLRLRKTSDIVQEVKMLVQKGVKEVIFIAQDTTVHPHLAEILKKSAQIPGLCWIRLMYAHPAHLTDEVIKVIAQEKKIVKYLDLPIQHACDKILKRMGRRYERLELENLIAKIKRRLPEAALRTSVIVGFPGEGEAEFQKLLDFIKKVKFRHVGAFTYSKEEGTPAAKMRGQVPAEVKRERLKRLMQAQACVARELNQKMIGRTLEVIIEKVKKEGSIGRSCFDAPEIDGLVFIPHKSLTPGEMVKVRITGAGTYDLTGVLT